MTSETYPIRCDCKPGTPENGWHEERGPACRAAEIEAWGRMFDRFREWIRDA